MRCFLLSLAGSITGALAIALVIYIKAGFGDFLWRAGGGYVVVGLVLLFAAWSARKIANYADY